MAKFKRLTQENWTDADETSRTFGRISPLAGPVRMGQEDWARDFLAIELAEHVPAHITQLFEVARGAMLYGWFFYPLFQLGNDQLYRVAEAAARHRYIEAGGPKSRPGFEEAIIFLTATGDLDAGRVERWSASRQLRNLASHPTEVSVVPPGAALRSMKELALDLNHLFRRNRTSEREMDWTP